MKSNDRMSNSANINSTTQSASGMAKSSVNKNGMFKDDEFKSINMNNLNISLGKNGYPSYQATVASMTSPSVASSTGAVTAMLNSVSLGLGSVGDDPTSTSQKDRIKSTGQTTSSSVAITSLSSSSLACASAATDSSIENRLENYELLTTVGTGTFGRVIVARHRQNKTFYALKVMSIAEVLRLKQTEHVKNEKEILMQISHPFIISLHWTYHNDKFLYMLLDYVCGGELFSYLRNAVKFSNDTAIFYAAEIVSALEYLHSQSIIYRDLKPENLLLDRDGHIRLCDFGFAKKVYDRTWTLCGTPEYLAPEIIVGKGHHKAVDYWALGILIYEMLVGYPPFYDENPFQIYQKILAAKIDWPRHIDLVAKDLIRKLLATDRTKRLGTMKNGAEDVKRHKWFKSIDWAIVSQKKLQPPIVPKVAHEGDTKNFDKYDEEGWRDVPSVPQKNLEAFEDF